MNEKKRVNLDMKKYGMFLALIAIYVIFAIMTGGKNLSPMNVNNLIMQNGYVVILAIGMIAGAFIAYLNIPPFVVTLATMLMGRGLTYTLLQAQTKGPFDQKFNFIGAVLLGAVTVDVVSKKKKGN